MHFHHRLNGLAKMGRLKNDQRAHGPKEIWVIFRLVVIPELNLVKIYNI
jgi:hypothetical protein